jgi:hypothetical protein
VTGERVVVSGDAGIYVSAAAMRELGLTDAATA